MKYYSDETGEIIEIKGKIEEEKGKYMAYMGHKKMGVFVALVKSGPQPYPVSGVASAKPTATAGNGGTEV